MIWRVGVVGDPIEHSLSPQLQVAGLTLAGLEGSASRLKLSADKTEQLRAAITNDFDALSVTMPLKQVAASLCDELDPVATRTGVVNSLLHRDGRIYGACTDGNGLLEMVKEKYSFVDSGSSIVVIGAGGAATGIIDALQYSDTASIGVLNRTTSKIDALQARYSKVSSAMPSQIDLLINTVPSDSRVTPSSIAGVSSETLCVDITYSPRESDWMKFFESEGCRTANGLGMLAYQAALQFNWWWNSKIDGSDLLKVIS